VFQVTVQSVKEAPPACKHRAVFSVAVQHQTAVDASRYAPAMQKDAV